VSRPAANARARGLLLIFAGAGLAYLLGVHWWFTAPMLEMGERIEDLRQQELALRMESRQRGEIEAKLAQVQQFESENPGFLPEGNKELASTGLLTRLEQVVQSATTQPEACSITARTPGDASSVGSKDPYPRVVVQVRLRCGMGELGAVLHALESGSPQVFVDNLDILSRRSYLAAGNEGGALDVSFDLYGYLSPAATSVGAPAPVPTPPEAAAEPTDA
jgi:general secretion pathway protein M